TTLPLGVWHAAVYAQAPGCFVSATLRRARLHRAAECLDFSNSLSPDFAGDGSDALLHVDCRRTGLVTTAKGLFVDRASSSALLLRLLPGDRLGGRLLRLPPGEEGTVAVALVAFFAAFLLSTGDVLRNDQVCGRSHARRGSGLG